jgi:arylsulfatase A-like enzyme
MKRKDVIRGIGALGLGATLSTALELVQTRTSTAQSAPRKANILFLMVDELRFPMHLPPGISDYRRFVQTYMPNLWRIWQKSVSFNNHHTAATACSPARASLFTGLYAHQHFQLITLAPNPQSPGTGLGIGLSADYPHLGRSLRQLGYQTWYFGKWHMSFAGPHPVLIQRGVTPANLVNFQGADYLNDYGYNGGSFPDPEGGGPLTGEQADPQIVSGFVTWSRTVRPRLQGPWCTVANAAGRSFILHTCDESIPNATAQYHVIGYRTNAELLTTYATWDERSGQINLAGARSQYYDFRNGNRLELVDSVGSSQAQQAIVKLQSLIASELRRPMTSALESTKQNMITKRFTYLNSALYQSLPQRVFDAVNW